MGNTRVWIGGIGSILYVLVMGVIAVLRWDELWQLELNALGDFLAGAFGPLAILWLVLGYFQQGEELRQNTEALHLQAAELRQSVKQQEQMVKVAREQLEEERARIKSQQLPSLRLMAYNDDSAYGVVAWVLEIHNYGAPCSKLQVTASCTTWELHETSIERLDPSKPWQLYFFPIDRTPPRAEPCPIEISGVTAGNQAFKAYGLLEFVDRDGHIHLEVETFRPEIDIGE